MTRWYDGDPELFVPASSVFPRIRSLERRVVILVYSTIASWLLTLAVAVKAEVQQPLAGRTAASIPLDIAIPDGP